MSGNQQFPSRNTIDNFCFDLLNPTASLTKAKTSFSTHVTRVCVSVWERARRPKGSYCVTDEELQSVTHMCMAAYSLCLFSLSCIKCFNMEQSRLPEDASTHGAPVDPFATSTWHSAPQSRSGLSPDIFIKTRECFLSYFKILLLSPSYCFQTKRKGKGQYIWGNVVIQLEITTCNLFSYLKAEVFLLFFFFQTTIL